MYEAAWLYEFVLNVLGEGNLSKSVSKKSVSETLATTNLGRILSKAEFNAQKDMILQQYIWDFVNLSEICVTKTEKEIDVCTSHIVFSMCEFHLMYRIQLRIEVYFFVCIGKWKELVTCKSCEVRSTSQRFTRDERSFISQSKPKKVYFNPYIFVKATNNP